MPPKHACVCLLHAAAKVLGIKPADADLPVNVRSRRKKHCYTNIFRGNDEYIK